MSANELATIVTTQTTMGHTMTMADVVFLAAIFLFMVLLLPHLMELPLLRRKNG